MKKGGKEVLFLTLILTSFLLGVLFSDYIGELYVQKFLKTPMSSIRAEEKLSPDKIFFSNKTKDLDLEKFWQVYDLIKEEYYEVDGLEKKNLIDGATKGLVESLGDKHSEFFNIEENEDFSNMLSGDFEGIGAVVDKLDIGVKIERVLKGSPAEKHGLFKDDVIIKAGEHELQDLSLRDAVDKIKGPAGTSVTLTVLRAGENEALEIEVIRKKIKIPSVEQEVFKEENIGYITVNLFGDDTAEEFSKALDSISNSNVDGLIIDLRNNGGGYLLSAVQMLSEFIESGELLVTTKYKDRFSNEAYKSHNSGGVFDKEIVILINGSSASASEITAGALREYNKAIVVGEKSYGKGSVQKPYPLSDGSLLKLTIAKWYTPLDKSIDGEGITPDVVVEFQKQDYNLEECKKSDMCEQSLELKDFEPFDRQLDEAKNILNEFISKGTIQLVIDEANERLGNKTLEEETTE